MNEERLYEILRPDSAEAGGRTFRAVHHGMVILGIAAMVADTVAPWRQDYGEVFAGAFRLAAAFFCVEYLLRLSCASAAPTATHPAWRARLAWAVSAGGLFDFFAALPGVLNLIFDTKDAILFGLIWVFKLARYAPGLARLQRAIANARGPLFSVLLGFVVVLLAASSLEYLLEHAAQSKGFGSLPEALWWGIVTMTNSGYGDTVPQTLLGRMLAGVVMVCGIVVLALLAGILATGFAQEVRRHAFLRTWNIVAQVPFFQNIGASTIAEVARLLRPRDYPAGAVIVRRGEPGDCMYFLAAGAVEIELSPMPRRLEPGEFFGEISLLAGTPRSATVIAAEASTLLRLDIADFRELMAREPELARVIAEAAQQRLGEAGTPLRQSEAAWDFGISA